MSKLSFRARTLDPNKPLPVYHADELPDLAEFNVINRAVPEMPTGMEKEEETEHHLQRAIAAQQLYGEAQQLVIPTPDFDSSVSDYADVYQNKHSAPRNYIRMHGFMMDTDYPDYDLDDEDESWCKSQPGLTPLKLESMIERLEKNIGQQSQNLELREAQGLLGDEDDQLVVTVFDYWQAKRARLSIPLIAAVKQERRDGSSSTDYYVAFRRRTEKMQTRKNRKNDEASYEKLCKLKRDMDRSCQLIALMLKREKMKQQLVEAHKAIFCHRYKMRDWNSAAYSSVMDQLFRPPPPPAPATTTTGMFPPHPAQANQSMHSQMMHSYGQQSMLQRGQAQQLNFPAHPSYMVSGMLGPNGSTGMPMPLGSVGETSATGDPNTAHWPPQQPAADGDFRQGKQKDRHSSKRKHHKKKHHPSAPLPTEVGTPVPEETPVSEEDLMAAHVDSGEDDTGPFAFKRRRHVEYCMARETLGNGFPFEEAFPDLPSNKRYRLYLTSMGRSGPFLGMARQRIGRGQRLCVDRGPWPFEGDDALCHSIQHGHVDVHSVSLHDQAVPYYQLDSPPPAKRVAYPPSSVKETQPPLLGESGVEVSSIDLSSFSRFPVSPVSLAGDDTESRGLEYSEDEDEDVLAGPSEFTDFGTCVRLSSSVPANVVHRSFDVDSGLESNGVSPLSDTHQSQQSNGGRSSGGKSSPSVSVATDDEGMAIDNLGRGLPALPPDATPSPSTALSAGNQTSSQPLQPCPSTGFLSVLSKNSTSWLKNNSANVDSMSRQRVPPALPSHAKSQSPIHSVLKVL